MKHTFKSPGMSLFRTIGLVLTLGASMTACSETTWKEEVLLHDGRKIIVTRSQIREGPHEIGQEPPIKEHLITFTPPGANKPVNWKSDDQYFRGLGLHLLLVDFFNGTPYLVTKPSGALAYKKWGSPNPPYIFFKFADQHWTQISITELPTEFTHPNLVVDIYGEKEIKSEEKTLGFVSVESIKKLNSNLTQEEYKKIVRTPLEIWKPRPQHLGAKAPQSIKLPGNASDSKK